jgi:molybdopterin converting factor small subunit
MKVRVVYTTQVKAALGISSEEPEVSSGCTVAKLMEELASCHPKVFAEFVLDGAQLRPSILLFVGDRQTSLEDSTRLVEGDEVTIFAAISGG